MSDAKKQMMQSYGISEENMAHFEDVAQKSGIDVGMLITLILTNGQLLINLLRQLGILPAPPAPPA